MAYPHYTVSMTGRQAIAAFLATAIVAAAIAFVAALMSCPAHARDDGRFANSPLKSWFDKLASGNGLCCSFADGMKIEDVDWDTGGQIANADDTAPLHYRVRICKVLVPGETWNDCKQKDWIVVPDSALVTEPNRFGPAVVWPYVDAAGVTQIRCFIPGAGA